METRGWEKVLPDGEGDVLDRAIVYAVGAHAGMTRKDSSTPYIYHPLEALAVAASLTDDHEVLAAAALHDVVEDTPTSLEDVEELFGSRVAEIVAGCSEDKREGTPADLTWKIRKEETLEHLAGCHDRDVLAVVLGDKTSNLRATKRDLDALGDEVWERFNEPDPLEHAWYYGGIAKAIENEMGDTAAWREYAQLVSDTFSRYGFRL